MPVKNLANGFLKNDKIILIRFIQIFHSIFLTCRPNKLIIGIGSMTNSASDVQAGAIKYDFGTNQMSFSDGSDWLVI